MKKILFTIVFLSSFLLRAQSVMLCVGDEETKISSSIPGVFVFELSSNKKNIEGSFYAQARRESSPVFFDMQCVTAELTSTTIMVKLDIGDFHPGSYVVRLVGTNGEEFRTFKIVKL